MTLKEREALQRWEEYHKSFAANIPIDTTLSQVEIEKQKQILEKDPIKWCLYFFPSYAKYDFAPFHIKAIKRIIEHEEWYEVLSWSRELAKSTIVMMTMMYIALTHKKRFFIITSATVDSAIRLLTPYRINFETNARIRQFYGKQVVLGQWTERDFTVKCGAKFLAIGAGSAPRGSRNEEIRPDVLIMDDFDTDEECRNPETLKKKWDWFNDALYPTRSISEKTLIIWCGNIIAKDCCITRAGAMADHWDIINIRDKQGKSTWAAKNSEEMIDKVLSKIPMSSVQKEYYNNPITEGKIFKNLPFGKIPALDKFKYLIVYGDPAYSDRKTKQGSFKAVWLVGYLKGVYYIIKGFLARDTNANFINWYFELKNFVQGKSNLFYYIENNKLQDPFYEQVFKPLLRKENERRHENLYIQSDSRKKTDKATRIETNLEPIDRLGKWIFNEDEKDNPHMQELINQAKLFEMHLPYPADGIDCLEGAVTMHQYKQKEDIPIVEISYKELQENNRFRLQTFSYPFLHPLGENDENMES